MCKSVYPMAVIDRFCPHNVHKMSFLVAINSDGVCLDTPFGLAPVAARFAQS